MENSYSAIWFPQLSKSVLIMVMMISGMISGNAQGVQHAESLSGEAADRLAIKEVIDSYSHDADRREAEKQAALFTPGGEI
jgi:hypothetical protein